MSGNGTSDRNEKPHVKKRAMLKALATTGNVTIAAESATIDRCTHYKWLKADEDYATAAEDAMDQAADRLEEAAWHRAVEGVEETHVGKDGKEWSTLRYSDTLLIFLMKGARPNKYRERHHVQQDININVADYFRKAAVKRGELARN